MVLEVSPGNSQPQVKHWILWESLSTSGLGGDQARIHFNCIIIFRILMVYCSTKYYKKNLFYR